jgi:hypothetical protein
MVCKDCKNAGRVMRLEPSDEHPAPMLEAELLHKRCQERQAELGTTSECDCQHRVNKNLINSERTAGNDS